MRRTRPPLGGGVHRLRLEVPGEVDCPAHADREPREEGLPAARRDVGHRAELVRPCVQPARLDEVQGLRGQSFPDELHVPAAVDPELRALRHAHAVHGRRHGPHRPQDAVRRPAAGLDHLLPVADRPAPREVRVAPRVDRELGLGRRRLLGQLLDRLDLSRGRADGQVDDVAGARAPPDEIGVALRVERDLGLERLVAVRERERRPEGGLCGGRARRRDAGGDREQLQEAHSPSLWPGATGSHQGGT
jgi:hypothetical protein